MTDRPIAYAVLTQALPEFVLGAADFQARGLPLLAHTETITQMRARCERCLQTLTETVGEDAMRGTDIATALTPVSDSSEDSRIGRPLHLIHPDWAATPGDLAVFDPRTGVLFAGALVEAQRIPNLRDGQIEGWIAALESLRALPLREVVPGHGAVGGPELINAMLGYLRALEAAVRERYDAGASLNEALAAVRLEGYAGWVGYESWHAANVQRVYSEIESRDLDGPPSRP